MLLGYVVGFVDDGDLVWGFTAAGFKEVVGGVGAPTAIATMMAERGLLVTQNAIGPTDTRSGSTDARRTWSR
jgi:hypothetical protein